MSVSRSTQALCLLFMFSLVGCGENATDVAKSGNTATAVPPAEEPPKEEYNAAGILIAYRGCEPETPSLEPATRTRTEALAIATKLRDQARSGEDFYELAREHSEGKHRLAGGVLGNFTEDSFVRQVAKATEKLEVGGISDPVDTHHGYYVVMRREVEELYTASHILIRHNDSEPPPTGLDRPKEKANELMELVLKSIEEGQNFNQLALAYSNGPKAKLGGQLGTFTISQLPGYFSEVGNVIKDLEIDEVSEPFETEVGIHLVKRQAIPKPSPILGAKHILVMYRGAMRADKISRSKEDAFERIKIVQGKLTKGQKFEDLAIEYSDCPSSKDGGDLGLFRQNKMAKEFSAATIECAVGAYTDIVESPFGYHLIHRYR